MAKSIEINWLIKPEDHDYSAARSFLSLMYDKNAVGIFIENLRKAPITEFKSKDILRASGLPLLGVVNSHVLKDKKKILSKERISPILLVRDSKNGKVIIADGYHRMCAVYYYNEDAIIPCQIA